ncbi:MAG: ice-binding family protein [Edaphobacter sp.]
MKTVEHLFILSIFSLSVHSLRADQLNVLGTANSFAVLGASTDTNTGSTVLNGDLGLYSGPSITGFPPGIVNGTIHNDDGVAMTAQADALTGYNDLKGFISTDDLTGQNLGGLTLTPGVYSYDSAALLSGTNPVLTLNFSGLSNQSIVIQIGTTLTTASDSSVVTENAGLNDSIYWAVGSSATLGTGTAFEGYLLANTSITLTTDASINCGSAIALNGAVTMDTNTISSCQVTSPSTVPEPATLTLLATGLLGVSGIIRRRFTNS